MSRDVPPDDDALLTAHADGVAELSPDERQPLETRLARTPALAAEHAEVRALLGRLRALPPEGQEPDWGSLERSIRQAVDGIEPRPWWRRWTWIAPATALAGALAVLLAIGVRTSGAPIAAPAPPSTPAPTGPADEPADETLALWLDGAPVVVDITAAEALDTDDAREIEGEALELLPTDDLAWVDRLDDAALVRAERWLARNNG